MGVLLHLAPEIEAKLQTIAATSGKSLEAVVSEVLAEHAASSSEYGLGLSFEDWNAALLQLLRSVPQSAAKEIATRREDIYADDGR